MEVRMLSKSDKAQRYERYLPMATAMAAKFSRKRGLPINEMITEAHSLLGELVARCNELGNNVETAATSSLNHWIYKKLRETGVHADPQKGGPATPPKNQVATTKDPMHGTPKDPLAFGDAKPIYPPGVTPEGEAERQRHVDRLQGISRLRRPMSSWRRPPITKNDSATATPTNVTGADGGSDYAGAQVLEDRKLATPNDKARKGKGSKKIPITLPTEVTHGFS